MADYRKRCDALVQGPSSLLNSLIMSFKDQMNEVGVGRHVEAHTDDLSHTTD